MIAAPDLYTTTGVSMPLLTRQTTVLGLAITAVLAAAEAPAQSTPGELPEVVVTARQRAERIEDVPATVRAFTDADIQSAGIERPTDFIELTPNVSQVQTAEAGDMQVVIRGINTGRDAETNFALVVDGVLQTNPNALNQELNGITQIEVLKGPQGAIYGRNALAGAIILTTRKPSAEPEFEVGAGIGSDNSYKGNLYFSGALGDNAQGSLSLYTRSTDGQWDNTLLGCDDCVDYFEESGAVGRLTFEAAGGEFDVKAKVSTVESGAINFNAAVSFFEAATIFGAPPFDEDPNDHSFFYTNNIIPENEQDNLNFSIKGDWDVGDNTLTGVFAYNDQTNYFLTDGAFDAALSAFGVMFTPNQEKAAAELARVVRKGGRVGLANWTPEGFIGQLFKTIGKHVPPPAGIKSPALWGTAARLAELFPGHRVRATKQIFNFRYKSPSHWLHVFKTYYGPTNRAFSALDAAKQAALEADIVDLLQRTNRGGEDTLIVPSEYLEVVVTKA